MYEASIASTAFVTVYQHFERFAYVDLGMHDGSQIVVVLQSLRILSIHACVEEESSLNLVRMLGWSSYR